SSRVLTEAMIGRSGRLQLLLKIGGHFDLQPARQCGLPSNQLPRPATFAVFAALYERAVDLDVCSQQMFPLIPGAVPDRMQDGWIKPELELATHIATQRAVVVEVALAQCHMEAPAPQLG